MFNKNTFEPGAITTSLERIPESKKDEWGSLRSAHGRSSADHPKRSKATFSVASTHLCNKAAKRRDTSRDLLGSSCVAQRGATSNWLRIASQTVE